MSQEGVEGFLGRLLTDLGCRHLAQSSLAVACREAGYDLTDEELMAIRREDLMRIELISERLNCRIKRLSFEPRGK
jgi:hypothetical protein